MKYTALFIALTIACSMCARISNQGKMGLSEKMRQLQSNKWGQLASTFLELQVAVGSPVDDLKQAFQDFFKDINFKIEIETYDFNVKEAEHDEWEAAIRDRIASAQADIAQATHHLDNVLYPRKAALEDALARDRQLIIDTEAAMAAATAEREANSAAHAAYIEEARVAIDAIDDCMTLLGSLGGHEAVGLIQMTKVKKSFEKVQKALAHTRFGTMIKALIKLADFTNSDMLDKLRNKFGEVRGSLVTGIADTEQEEADQQAAYDEFMALSTQTIADANQRIIENTAALEATNQEIADTIAFRAQREADLAVAEQDLANELERWANEVAIFENLMGELHHELDVLDEVIGLLASIDVSDETAARMNQ